jgi:hypothetical protein
MQAIRDYMTDARVNDSVIPKMRAGRYLSRALIPLMSTTGVTPGLEVREPTQHQIEFRKDTNGRPALRVAIHTNRGKRADDRIVGRVIMMSGRC